jgi:hypothetical protein
LAASRRMGRGLHGSRRPLARAPHHEELQQADKSPYDLILRSGSWPRLEGWATGYMVRDARLRGLLTMRETSASPTGKSAIWLSSLISDFPKNILVPTHPKSVLELSLSHPQRGVSRSSRTRDGIAGRVGERPVSDQQRADERCCSVRRSRVVLTPRRWRQVRGGCVGPTGLRQNLIR